MIRRCAWCDRDLGEIAPFGDQSVTHGICPECYAEELRKLAEDGEAECLDNREPAYEPSHFGSEM